MRSIFKDFLFNMSLFGISALKIHNFWVSKLEFGKFLGLRENSGPSMKFKNKLSRKSLVKINFTVY